MTFNQEELVQIDKIIGEPFRNRVPPDLRDKIRYDIEIEGHNVILLEIRPHWREPDKHIKLEFARLRYIHSRKIWKLYWQRASGKWEAYQPLSEAPELQTLVKLIDQDQFGCFFG